MALIGFNPHRCGQKFWEVWDYPQTVHNQTFGLDMDDNQWTAHNHNHWPNVRQPKMQKNGISDVVNNSKKFEVKLDCSSFRPEEIEVKIINENIIVHGKHDEKMDDHGFISREFWRKYPLPEECDPNHVTTAISPKGNLTIRAPKMILKKSRGQERVVPISLRLMENYEEN